MEREKVTIGVINFNGMGTLPETLESVYRLDYPDFEVIVVDNHSTDGSREWVLKHFPQARCICLNANRGPAGARNKILQQAWTDYLFTIDNDIVLEPDVLTRLMDVMKTVPQAAVCHPEICDPQDPLAYHYNGGWVHYLCAFVSRPEPEALEPRPDYEVFDGISGAALLIRRSFALQIGGFDEDYFFNWEDGDFAVRFTLAGYLCLNVPNARVYHHGKPRGTSKIFYQIRNRWFFTLKLYSWRTLLLGAPMFILFELSLLLFLLMKGVAKEYVRGNLAAFFHLPHILEKRRAFQKLKIKRDRDWLRGGELYVPENLLDRGSLKWMKKVYCDVLDGYWKMIRPFC